MGRTIWDVAKCAKDDARSWQAVLAAGWEPFAVDAEFVWFRRSRED